MKIHIETLLEDEYRLIITCLDYMVIVEKYDDLSHMHDNVSFILKCSPIRVSTLNIKNYKLQLNVDVKVQVLLFLLFTFGQQNYIGNK